jgi:serine/threonine protein kinase
MDFCEKGSLRDLLKVMEQHRLVIGEDRIWKIISQFFIALAIMNSKNLAHRDVKEDNICIDENYNIVLGMKSFILYNLYYH